ncbi:NAD(P)-dependent oxidoreductase [Agrococcus sp. SL85]|uniref:NAD-dependent epimerase/dehydratase family protein n=1 Tax=Agrococcus sp. SL85 TaxID=2995141 RepID=UPI00226D1D9C|nr:NAD(P)-dependent oxidoreductase [Agrococcus sp. SL85]WAC65357.1 NAD(P)-dependent oxidoreductase [Agrococcus sp. SL85]
MRVLVTGASGFVGGAVATALAARGDDVVGLGRRAGGWAHEGGRYERRDLAAPLDDLGAFDAVVHAAALADDWAPLAEAMRVNRDGAAAVARALPAARFVHVSTASVYDASVPTVAGREDAPPPTRFLSAYSASKAAAERALSGRAHAILRPHAVYGPGDTTLLPRVLDARRGPLLPLPGGGRALHTLTHVRTLVAACLAAADASEPLGIVNVGDAPAVPLAAVIEGVLAARGERARIVPVPVDAAMALAAAAERRARRIGGRPRLTRYAVSQVGMERTLDLTRMRERLGLVPRPVDLAGARGW